MPEPELSYFQLCKTLLTDKYYIAIISLIGVGVYVLLYWFKKRTLVGLQQPVALGFGTSLGGIFTGIGILFLGLDKSSCQEVSDIRAFIMLGGLSAIWIAGQSIGAKYKALRPVEAVVPTPV